MYFTPSHLALVALLMLFTVSTPALNHGSVTGRVRSSSGRPLDSLTVTVGGILIPGDTASISSDGRFRSNIPYPGAVVISISARGHASLLIYQYEEFDVSRTYDLNVVLRDKDHGGRTSYMTTEDIAWLDRDTTRSDTITDILLEFGSLIEHSTLRTIDPLNLSRRFDADPAPILRDAQRLYESVRVGPPGKRQRTATAYCLMVMSMIHPGIDSTTTTWVRPLLAELPQLLPPDDLAWTLCFTSAWLLDTYSDINGLAAYQRELLTRHPVLDNRMVMYRMAIVNAFAQKNEAKWRSLYKEMEAAAPDHHMTKLVREDIKL